MTTVQRTDAVLKRAEILRKERRRREEQRLSAVSGISGMLLIICIFVFSGGSATSSGDNYYGSTPLYKGAGGYVLVAVLAFVAAVAVTLLCVRYRDRHKDDR